LFSIKNKGICKTKEKVRTYCTSGKTESIKLNPWFVTGLSDGDGSFYIVLRKDSTCRFGFSISLEYKVVAGVNPLNLKLLELVQSFFGGMGIISKDKNTYHYVIRNRNHLCKVREHFDNYPLQTTKHLYFKLWSKVLDLIERKDHLTVTGFMEVLAIKSVFPNALNDSIKGAFPDITSIIKPEFISNTYKLNGHWIAGFTQADGSFGLNYSKATKMRLGYTCQPQFRVTQHERDVIVLKRIIEYLGCSVLRNTSKIKYEWSVSVSNHLDLVNIVIPFFQKHSIYGAKQSDFLDFSLGMDIINKKGHLTPEGLNELNKMAYRMNSYRKF
jgi:hypothetical protein